MIQGKRDTPDYTRRHSRTMGLEVVLRHFQNYFESDKCPWRGKLKTFQVCMYAIVLARYHARFDAALPTPIAKDTLTAAHLARLDVVHM